MTKARTTKKEFKLQVQNHIIERLSTNETTELKQQLKNVLRDFVNWYSPYEKKVHSNTYQAFTSFLQGLPSCLNVEFEYYPIHLALKEWFENTGNTYVENETRDETRLYYHLVTREFIALCQKNNLFFQ